MKLLCWNASHRQIDSISPIVSLNKVQIGIHKIVTVRPHYKCIQSTILVSQWRISSWYFWLWHLPSSIYQNDYSKLLSISHSNNYNIDGPCETKSSGGSYNWQTEGRHCMLCTAKLSCWWWLCILFLVSSNIRTAGWCSVPVMSHEWQWWQWWHPW